MRNADSRSGYSHRGTCRTIDHTLLKPDATRRGHRPALRRGPGARIRRRVRQQPWVERVVAARLDGSAVKPCSVVGFPLGASLPPPPPPKRRGHRRRRHRKSTW
jgi:deoxyribose-phosphate aldolase